MKDGQDTIQVIDKLKIRGRKAGGADWDRTGDLLTATANPFYSLWQRLSRNGRIVNLLDQSRQPLPGVLDFGQAGVGVLIGVEQFPMPCGCL